jgi:hypothetical protein
MVQLDCQTVNTAMEEGAGLLERLLEMHHEMRERFDEVRKDNLEVRAALRELEGRLDNINNNNRGGATMRDDSPLKGIRRDSQRASGDAQREMKDGSLVAAGGTFVDKEIGGQKAQRALAKPPRVAKEFLDEGIRTKNNISGSNGETKAGG